MGQEKAARFLGAGLAAAAATTLLLMGWEQCVDNGVRVWLLLAVPVLTAMVFTLPRPGMDAYFRNGLAVALGIACVAGFYGSVAGSPTNCEVLFPGVSGYFIFWGIFSGVILVVGAVPFGVLLFILRQLKIVGA